MVLFKKKYYFKMLICWIMLRPACHFGCAPLSISTTSPITSFPHCQYFTLVRSMPKSEIYIYASYVYDCGMTVWMSKPKASNVFSLHYIPCFVLVRNSRGNNRDPDNQFGSGYALLIYSWDLKVFGIIARNRATLPTTIGKLRNKKVVPYTLLLLIINRRKT